MPRRLNGLTLPVALAFVAGGAAGAVAARWGKLPAWGAALPAVTALVGVALGQYMTSERDARERRARERDVERDIVVEIVLAARAWQNLMSAYVPFLVKATMQDILEFVDTDSGVTMGENTARWQSSTTKGKLFLRSGELSRLLTQLVDTQTILVDKSLFDSELSHDSKIEAAGKSLGRLDAWSELVDQFESEASSALGS